MDIHLRMKKRKKSVKPLNLHKAFLSAVREIPFKVLDETIERKLRDKGIQPDIKLVASLREKVLTGGHDDYFTYDDGSNTETVKISEEELADILTRCRKFVDQIPSLIESLSSEISTSLLKSYRRRWIRSRDTELLLEDAFRSEIDHWWGKGIDQLEILLALSMEIGEQKLNVLSRSRAKRDLRPRETIIRLHVRGCQVVREIVTLLKNGLADGAFARWRTLHEISVVALLMNENGDDLVYRYLDHEAIESKRAADQYERSRALLGYAPLSKAELRKIDREYSAAIKKHGVTFAGPYGWAAKLLNKRNPNFSDLESATDRAMHRSFYRMASYNVHAGPKGLSFRLTDTTSQKFLVAGSSIFGIDEPGQHTAVTLCLLTSLLLFDPPTLDDVTLGKMLIETRNQAVRKMVTASSKIQREERKRVKLLSSSETQSK